MKLTNIELDGELYTHNTAHQYIHGIVSRTVNMHSDFESIEYHIFDIIEGKKQADRLLQLAEIKHIIADKGIKNIRIVPFNAIDASIEAVTDKMDSYISSGYEGIIIRHPFAIYERKRSIYIMKFKPRKDDYYTITGTVEEVSQYGELKDTLGALILDSDNLDVNMEPQTFQVGSGSFLTREKRKELWENRLTLVGALAHVKYQHLTERKVPRFPVLVDIIKPA
jgi:ATP-dependent DNA ligase